MWIFKSNGNFPAGVFSSKAKAAEAIAKYKLSGCLTLYPADTLVYDWCIDNDFFTPKNERQKTPKFIESFSSAYQEHYHYTDGEECA